MNPAEQMLDAHVGREIAGGCDSCEAVQAVHREAEGVFRLVISHDDGCPVLDHHTRVAPVEAHLAKLREQWRWWRDLDIERVAAMDDIDLGDRIREAGGDRVLAIQAWRVGRMAEINELGKGLAATLEAGE